MAMYAILQYKSYMYLINYRIMSQLNYGSTTSLASDNESMFARTCVLCVNGNIYGGGLRLVLRTKKNEEEEACMHARICTYSYNKYI